MGKQGVALKDHPDPPLSWRQISHFSITQEYPASINLFQASDASQRSRLTAAARSKENQELFIFNAQIDVVYRYNAAESPRYFFQPYICHGLPSNPLIC